MKGCELCGRAARMYCESDEACLCFGCDAKVHGANFLVARHSRILLCRSCQAPTPWKASGTQLGPTVSVCEMCAGRRGRCGVVGKPGREEEVAENEEELATPPPPSMSCSSSEESCSSSRRTVLCTRKLKRMRENEGPSSSQDNSGCLPKQKMVAAATAAALPCRRTEEDGDAEEEDEEATSFRDSFRPGKDRKKAGLARPSPVQGVACSMGRLRRAPGGGFSALDLVSSDPRDPRSERSSTS